MKIYSGVIRYIIVCFSCFCVILLSFFNNFYSADFSIEKEEKTKTVSGAAKQVINQVIIEEDSDGKDDTEAESEAKESKAVQGSKVYKGKIISRYISPYSAPTSYGKVYMKNITGENVSIKKLINEELSFKIKKTDEPQVLIVHTHTTETYMREESEYYTEEFSSRSRNTEYNMVKIGKTVAEKLNDAGIVTLHATSEHDYPEYTGSYSRAAKTIKNYLDKYPSIKVVLDLHRDAVSSGESDKVKLVTEIDGKKAAQVMLVMGSETGGVSSFPDWQENLKLAFRLQQALEENYPTLARPLYLTSKKYNQNLTKGSLLIEFGTDANTIDEAVLSAEYVGEALVKVLNNLK